MYCMTQPHTLDRGNPSTLVHVSARVHIVESLIKWFFCCLVFEVPCRRRRWIRLIPKLLTDDWICRIECAEYRWLCAEYWWHSSRVLMTMCRLLVIVYSELMSVYWALATECAEYRWQCEEYRWHSVQNTGDRVCRVPATECTENWWPCAKYRCQRVQISGDSVQSTGGRVQNTGDRVYRVRWQCAEYWRLCKVLVTECIILVTVFRVPVTECTEYGWQYAEYWWQCKE